ncbi:MAG: cell envelope integrity protein TolA [Oxalobacter sp.]
MQHGILIPKIPKLSAGSLALAVVVHCLLIGALWFGVSWQPKPEQLVSAEVWDVKVREAAPLAAGEMAVESGSPDAGEKTESINTQESMETRALQPEARPVPAKEVSSQERPDIALVQERRRAEQQAAEHARREAELRRQLAQAQADSRRQAEAKRLKALLSAEAGRVAAGFGGGRGAGLGGGTAQGTGGGGTAYGRTGTGGTGTNAYATGPGRADGVYIRRVAAKIKSNTIYNVSTISGNPAVVYDVDLYPDGSVRSIRKRRSSGVTGFDEAVRQAVYRSAPYPRDSSGRVPSSFVLTHRPKG